MRKSVFLTFERKEGLMLIAPLEQSYEVGEMHKKDIENPILMLLNELKDT